MLVLTRQTDETIVVTHVPSGDRLELMLVEVRKHGKVRIGFTAAKEKFAVHRAEVQARKDEE